MPVTEAISELIRGELPVRVACERLLQLASVPPSPDLIDEVVEAVKATADPDVMSSLAKIEGLMDCCGTGGSKLPHYNASTTVAFVLAAGGVRVAKWGNRSASSACGSADLLEALDIPLTLPSSAFKEIIEETNLAFLFAPQFYPGLHKIATIRKAVASRTIFNLVAPLLNPAQPQFRLLGVTSGAEQEAVANHLARTGAIRRAYVVTSQSGLDELDPFDINTIKAVEKNAVREFSLSGRNAPHTKPQNRLTVEMNLSIFHKLINNEEDDVSYYRDLIRFNAGAGFSIAGKVSTIDEGLAMANQLLASGAVLRKFEQCKRVYGRFAK
jgi:anthranilate phosphoribosyltransferase